MPVEDGWFPFLEDSLEEEVFPFGVSLPLGWGFPLACSTTIEEDLDKTCEISICRAKDLELLHKKKWHPQVDIIVESFKRRREFTKQLVYRVANLCTILIQLLLDAVEITNLGHQGV